MLDTPKTSPIAPLSAAKMARLGSSRRLPAYCKKRRAAAMKPAPPIRLSPMASGVNPCSSSMSGTLDGARPVTRREQDDRNRGDTDHRAFVADRSVT
jgi:hypothetical protein